MLIFRDMSVKFGDFGVSLKIPDKADYSYTQQLVGITKMYSSKSAVDKYEAGEALSFEEMVNNDYYCL